MKALTLTSTQQRVGVSAPGIPRRLRFTFGATLSLLTVILVDLTIGMMFCGDGQFRQWRLPPYPLLFTENQAKWLYQDDWPYYRFDRDLGWTLRPNATFAEGRYRTNSAGIRADREYELEPPPNVTRIAVFGDSFVHGDEVDNAQTAWRLLEEQNPHLEVLNFGVPGYGTDQAYLRYLNEGARFKPNVVLVGLMLENIQRNVSVFRPAYYHDTGLPLAKPRYRVGSAGLELMPCPASSLTELRELISTGRLVDTLCETDYWVRQSPLAFRGSALFHSSLMRIGYAAYADRGRSQRDYYLDSSSEPYQVASKVLETFCRRAESDGASRALVLVLPDKSTVRELAAGDDSFYWGGMIHDLERRGVPCRDFTPALLEATRHESIDAHFAGTHYSPRGHALLAGFVRDAVISVAQR
jgi:hypothetical protein